MKRDVSVRRHLRRKPREPDIARAQFHPSRPGAPMRIGSKEGPEAYVRFTGHTGGAGSLGEQSGLYARKLYIGPDALRENAVHNIDVLLGLNVVPATYIRPSGVEQGGDEALLWGMEGVPEGAELAVSVQEVVPYASSYSAGSVKHRDDVTKIAVLDFIANNTDRHSGNMLIDREGHVHAIDHELTFGAFAREEEELNDPGYHEAEVAAQGRKIPASLLRRMRELEKGDFTAALAGIDPNQIEYAWNRFVHIRKLGKIPPAPEYFEDDYDEEEDEDEF